MPYEDVRDFFYDHHNHIPQLDHAAEQMFEECGLTIGSLDRQLARVAEERAGVTVLVRGDGADPAIPKRHYDPESRTLRRWASSCTAISSTPCSPKHRRSPANPARWPGSASATTSPRR
ncbi:transcriptional regulatory protein [Mycobacteroides abscessus subsp. abscessus]|nr:transcriptional regulatory protein [Mycobacteroides abscessus subsp. abscessus]